MVPVCLVGVEISSVMRHTHRLRDMTLLIALIVGTGSVVATDDEGVSGTNGPGEPQEPQAGISASTPPAPDDKGWRAFSAPPPPGPYHSSIEEVMTPGSTVQPGWQDHSRFPEDSGYAGTGLPEQPGSVENYAGRNRQVRPMGQPYPGYAYPQGAYGGRGYDQGEGMAYSYQGGLPVRPPQDLQGGMVEGTSSGGFPLYPGSYGQNGQGYHQFPPGPYGYQEGTSGYSRAMDQYPGGQGKMIPPETGPHSGFARPVPGNESPYPPAGYDPSRFDPGMAYPGLGEDMGYPHGGYSYPYHSYDTGFGQEYGVPAYGIPEGARSDMMQGSPGAYGSTTAPYGSGWQPGYQATGGYPPGNYYGEYHENYYAPMTDPGRRPFGDYRGYYQEDSPYTVAPGSYVPTYPGGGVMPEYWRRQ